jgi:superfamily I DNA/RNA helicase
MLGITPQGKQEEVMALPAKGHIIVLGTAGSGKTTIALLRAHHLANIPNGGRVLLVTFNRALVEYMRGICDSNLSELTVENYHKFARGYLSSRGKMPRGNGILENNEKANDIEQAVEDLKKQYPNESTFRRPKQFFVDEITFIERFGFTDLNSYYDAERIGRSSANIKRENRKWIFAVYKRYIELREKDGYKYDWDDLAFYVYCELQGDDSERRYSHIIVDEGQDFSPMMIKSLVDAVAVGGSFTFFGDVAQQIYGSRLSWRDSGINTEKIWRFDINYRNPAVITEFAKDITKSEYWQQDVDMVNATVQIAEGLKPVLVEFSCKQRELSWVVDRAISNGKISSTVIICRNRADIDQFMRILKNKGCYATEIDKRTPGYAHIKTVYLTTFHSAKGLEFDNVFIPFLNNDKLPDPETVANAVSKEEAYTNEIKLLYVAATRSKFGLYMSYSGILSPLFPENSDSYDFYDEEDLL